MKYLWKYRFFIANAVKSDINSRLARSKLGFFWIIIQPFIMALTFTLILSMIMNAKFEGVDSQYAYSIYILAGLLCWTLISDTIIRSTNMFIENKDIILKISVPKIVIPAIVFFQAMINAMVMFLVIVVVVIAIGHPVSLSLFLFPVVFALSIFLLVSIGTILGIINVFVRDLGHFVTVFLQLAFWFTPIVYTLSVLPEPYQKYMELNPFSYFVEVYQNLLLYGQPPSLSIFIITFSLIIISSISAIFFFKRAEADLVEEL